MDIHTLKQGIKQFFRSTSPDKSKRLPTTYSRRQYHIAYSMLRGKTYEQVENKVHDCNRLNSYDWGCIDQIQDLYPWPAEEVEAYLERKARREEHAEDVRLSA